MDATTIIGKLGGRDALSHLTGATPNAVTQWRRDGIPAKYWIDLIEEAQRRGVRGITKDVLRGTWPKNRGRQRSRLQASEAA